MADVKPINDSTENSDEETPLIASQPKWRQPRTIVVEPLLCIVAMCWKGRIPLIQYYLTERFTSQNPVLSNESYAPLTNGNDTCSSNRSDPWYIATQHVQEKTSQWILYQNMVMFTLALLSVPFYGAFSDYAGRRIVLLIPCVGFALHMLVNTLVIFLNLEPWIMLIGAAIDGISGSPRALSMAAWAYIADTNVKEARARRFVLLEACYGFASGAAQIALGYWIKATSILPPSIFLTGCLLFCFIYIMFFVPEPRVLRRERLGVCDYLSGMVQVYTKKDPDGQRHRGQLLILLLALFLYVTPGTNKASLLTLFTTDPPLCWGAVLVSYSYGAIYTSENLGGLVGVLVFKRLGLTEAGIGVVSLLSALPCYVMIAFSWKTWMVFVASVFVLFGNLIYPMIVTLISNACEANVQGSAMSGVIWIDTLCSLFGGVLLNEIYQETLFFMNGFVFLVCGGMVGLSLLVFICATFVIKQPQHVPK
ncbi:proton-coupled folate transporter-like [Lineus longissimus]|uniref:proton-coupled folate transporter-like n=1 Tax=Lineus longissimus TaxID=88925 RepID=UPI002B4F332F